MHRRAFCWVPGDGIVVVDRLACSRPHEVVASLHLGDGAGPTVRALGDGPAPAVVDDRVAPFLGSSRPATAMRRSLRVGPGAPFGWSLLRSDARVEISAGHATVRRPKRSDLRFRVA